MLVYNLKVVNYGVGSKILLVAGSIIAAGIVLAVVLGPAVSSPEPPSPEPPSPEKPTTEMAGFEYDPETEADCTMRGGSYFMAAMYYICEFPVSDEGKWCTDSSQCEDICKAEDESAIAGSCGAFSHGCDLVLSNGQTHWMCS